MRLFAFVLLSALLSSLAFPAQIDSFINASFEPGQTVVQAAFVSSPQHMLVLSDGTETYVFDVSKGTALKDAAALEALFISEVKAQGGYGAKVNSSLSFPKAVRDAKKANESMCMQYTGIDMHPCTDKQTCTVSCFAVPNCVSVLYADGFVEEMQKWNEQRQAFDSALVEYESGLSAVATDTSAIDLKLVLLSDLAQRASAISSSTIFLNRTDPGCAGKNATLRCFEYCPKADYSVSRIASQKTNLQALKSLLAQIAQQREHAALLLNSSKTNDNYLANRGGDYQDLRLEMYNDIRKINASMPAYLAKVDDSGINASLDSLDDLSGQINSYADSGMYKKALSQKLAFEDQASKLKLRISGGTMAFDNLTAQFSSFETKVTKAGKIIGDARAADYIAKEAEIKVILAPPATVEEIATAQKSLAALGVALYDEVSANALGEPVNPETGETAVPQQPSNASLPVQLPSGTGLPCLPALILLAIFAFAASRRL